MKMEINPARGHSVDQIAEWLRAILSPDQLCEVRALDYFTGRDRVTMSGIFEGREVQKIARVADSLTDAAKGVYLLANPIHPGRISRTRGRVTVALNAIADHQIACRRWLVFDFDPVRPDANSSSSAAEKEQAYHLARTARHWIELNFPDLRFRLFADSGNGFHLWFRTPKELATEEAKSILATAADQFDSKSVRVDRKVFNLSRIFRLYGTVSRKGEDTGTRPHRASEVIESEGAEQ